MNYSGTYKGTCRRIDGASEHGNYEGCEPYIVLCMVWEVEDKNENITIQYTILPNGKPLPPYDEHIKGTTKATIFNCNEKEKTVDVELDQELYFHNLIWNHDQWEKHKKFRLNMKDMSIGYAY